MNSWPTGTAVGSRDGASSTRAAGWAGLVINALVTARALTFLGRVQFYSEAFLIPTGLSFCSTWSTSDADEGLPGQQALRI